MRLGIVLREPWADDARRAQELGFDLGWIDERDVAAPLIVAASLAATTDALRIVARVEAGTHPVSLAEEAAVCDLALGGRLVLAVGGDDEPLVSETVELLQHAFAARPFRHAGPRWTVPARLPEHTLAPPLARVTPAPAQLELPIWLTGAAGPPAAAAHGLSFVAGTAGEDDPLAGWRAIETRLGPAAARLRRPGMRAVAATGFDAGALVARLHEERTRWGLDVAVLEIVATDAERAALLARVAREVRPQLQLAELPDGLADYWAAGGDAAPGSPA